MQEGRTVKEFAKTTMIAGAESSSQHGAVAGGAAARRIFRCRRFMACACAKNFDLNEVFQYINHTALFKNQWQLKTASQADYLRIVEEKYVPVLV